MTDSMNYALDFPTIFKGSRISSQRNLLMSSFRFMQMCHLTLSPPPTALVPTSLPTSCHTISCSLAATTHMWRRDVFLTWLLSVLQAGPYSDTDHN